jgi:hypothetical protein
VDLTTPTIELTVRGGPRKAETVQHVSQQGGEAGTVQPITTEPHVSTKSGVGVVVHLSKKEK